MPENGKTLVSLVVALAGSLKGVADVVRAIRERSRASGVPHETARDLADALENAERDLRQRTEELAACIGAKLDVPPP